jgi:putative toxin-antitoxin system antitoxin component (TIGR02293 family)
MEAVIRRIRLGLPANSFNQMALALGLPKKSLAVKLRVAPRTINRQQKTRSRLSAETSEKVMRLVRIRNFARQVFTDDRTVADWLAKPDGALGGTAPIDLLDTDVGARSVESLLQGMIYGNVI